MSTKIISVLLLIGYLWCYYIQHYIMVYGVSYVLPTMVLPMVERRQERVLFLSARRVV